MHIVHPTIYRWELLGGTGDLLDVTLAADEATARADFRERRQILQIWTIERREVFAPPRPCAWDFLLTAAALLGILALGLFLSTL